jgi:hypothetical protein
MRTAGLHEDDFATDHDALLRVGWTRGAACAEVADVLSAEPAVRIDGDMRATCVHERIGAIVSRKLTSFDLVPMVVPQAVELDAVGSVTAAIGEGPHSPLAVDVAARIAGVLGIPCGAVSVYRGDEDRSRTEERLAELTRHVPDMEPRTLEGTSAVELVDDLHADALLVVGAPGGSWFQRQIFGPGHRLTVGAPAGVVIVRSAPPRCFHMGTDDSESVVGPHMAVGDVKRLVHHRVVAVADHGILVGVVRVESLEASDDAVPVSDLMEPPVSVDATETADVIADVRPYFDGSPIPVIDREGRIVGMVPAPG